MTIRTSNPDDTCKDAFASNNELTASTINRILQEAGKIIREENERLKEEQL